MYHCFILSCIFCGGKTSLVASGLFGGISYRSGSLCFSSLEAYPFLDPMMRYCLKTGNRFLLIKDEVTDVLSIFGQLAVSFS